MKCIVPLAGPDIYNEKYGLKPAYEIDGDPLLVKAIHSRFWYGKSLYQEDLIFIIRDFEYLVDLKNLLQSNFPSCKQVIIPNLTKGALLTTLAGSSLLKCFSEPIVVDLVDIIFKCKLDPLDIFGDKNEIAGIIPYFKSKNPKYSYLQLDDKSRLTSALEKRVISDNASAGVYFFRNISYFMRSVLFSIINQERVSYNDLLYLCPSFNALIDDKNSVLGVEVNEVFDFHNSLQI